MVDNFVAVDSVAAGKPAEQVVLLGPAVGTLDSTVWVDHTAEPGTEVGQIAAAAEVQTAAVDCKLAQLVVV